MERSLGASPGGRVGPQGAVSHRPRVQHSSELRQPQSTGTNRDNPDTTSAVTPGFLSPASARTAAATRRDPRGATASRSGGAVGFFASLAGSSPAGRTQRLPDSSNSANSSMLHGRTRSVEAVTQDGLLAAAGRQRKRGMMNRLQSGGTLGGTAAGAGGSRAANLAARKARLRARTLNRSLDTSIVLESRTSEQPAATPAAADATKAKLGDSVIRDEEDQPLDYESVLQRWQHATQAVMSSDKLRIVDVFRRFDKDNDGFLTPGEFSEGAEMAGLILSAANLSTLFVGLNSDKKVDKLSMADFSKGLTYKHERTMGHHSPGQPMLGLGVTLNKSGTNSSRNSRGRTTITAHSTGVTTPSEKPSARRRTPVGGVVQSGANRSTSKKSPRHELPLKTEKSKPSAHTAGPRLDLSDLSPQHKFSSQPDVAVVDYTEPELEITKQSVDSNLTTVYSPQHSAATAIVDSALLASATQNLAQSEARMVRDFAAREAQAIKKSAEIEAKLVREAAEKEAHLATKTARRVAEAEVTAAKFDADRIRNEAEQKRERAAFETDEQTAQRIAEDEEHAKKLVQARGELLLLQSKLDAAKADLGEKQMAQLQKERDNMQAQLDELHAALMSDRQQFEEEAHHTQQAIAAEQHALEQAREGFVIEDAEHRDKLEETLAAMKAEAEAEISNSREAFLQEMLSLRTEVESELLAKQNEANAQAENLETIRNRIESELKQDLQFQQDSMTERLKQQEQLAAERLQSMEHDANDRILRAQEQADQRLRETEKLAMANLDSELQLVRAAADRDIETRRVAAARELEQMNFAAETEMKNKQADIEREVASLESQIKAEMESSEEGAIIYRLHHTTKLARQQAEDAIRAKRRVELERDEQIAEVEDLRRQLAEKDKQIMSLEADCAGKEKEASTGKSDLEASLLEIKQISASLAEARNTIVKLEAQLSTAQAECSSAKHLLATAEREAVSARGEVSELQARVDSGIRDIAEYEATNQLLLRAEADHLSTQKELKETNKALNADLEDARAQSVSANEKLVNLTQDMTIQQEKARGLSLELDRVQLERNSLKVENLAATRRADTAETDLSVYKDEIRRRDRDKEREINDLRNRIDELVQSEATLKADLTRAEAMPSAQSHVLEVDHRIRVELNEAQAQIRTLSREAVELRKSLAVSQRKQKDAEANTNLVTAEAEHAQRSTTNMRQQLTEAQRTVDELKAAVSARDLAASQSQAGFASSVAKIRAEHDRERSQQESRFRKAQTQSKEFQAKLSSVTEQRAMDAEQLAQLQRELRSCKSELLAAQGAETAARDQLKDIRAQLEQRMAEQTTQLGQQSASIASLKAESDRLKSALDIQKREHAHLEQDYKENIPRKAVVESATHNAARALDLLQKTVSNKDSLVAKLGSAFDENRDLQARLEEARTSGTTIKERLNESRMILRNADQIKKSYMGLWGAELGRSSALRRNYDELHGSMLDVQRHDAKLAIDLDQLEATNDALQHQLTETLTGQETLSDRIASYEDQSTRDVAELRMSARLNRSMASQFQSSAAELARNQAESVKEERERNAKLRASMKKMERDHKELMDAYVTEVGDQRREIDRLRQSEDILRSSLLR